MDFGSLGSLPRQVTWPAGFTAILMVFGLIALAFRRRSAVWSALVPQFWTAALLMLLVTLGIAAMLPASYWSGGAGG
ncbi:MAG: hypothetical protein L6E13_11795 [Firmicutes bacterium]|nr:hypothetical protein [Bacillota bacterium]